MHVDLKQPVSVDDWIVRMAFFDLEQILRLAEAHPRTDAQSHQCACRRRTSEARNHARRKM